MQLGILHFQTQIVYNKVLARDLSIHLYNGHITPSTWTGRIKKFNRCDILKILVEKILWS